MTITHDALDLTIQPLPPADMGPHYTDPLSPYHTWDINEDLFKRVDLNKTPMVLTSGSGY